MIIYTPSRRRRFRSCGRSLLNFERPVMLYSIGKDSSVLLRLAQKAFYPGPNGRLNPGETIRVFPLSNWTELDVWHYIDAERIPVVKRRLRRSR